MASIAPGYARQETGDRFFFGLAAAMALVLVAGFSMQLAMGRSTFAARPLVHIHGVAFMAWVGLFLTQSWLGTRGPIALHRRLGWIGAGWAVVLVIVGTALMFDVIRRGSAAFFFRPQPFLIANLLSLMTFAGLTAAAIRLRRRTDWHKRLHVCGMAAITGPGFGRLLPMPLLIPYAFEIAAGLGLLFPLAGIIRDWRRDGHVHPAWWWGTGAIALSLLLIAPLALSPFGDWLYAAATEGAPGATVAPLDYPPPPLEFTTGR